MHSSRTSLPCLYVFAAVFLLLDSPAVQAQGEQQPPGLFERVHTVDAMTPAGRGPVRRSEQVAVKPGLLGNLKQPAQTVTLNLFDDTIFVAHFQRSETNRLGSYAWIGSLDGHPFGQAILVITDGLVAGSISLPGANYEIKPGKGDTHSINQLDHSAYPQELPPIPSPPVAKSSIPDESLDVVDSCEQIQVLVAYSPEAKAAVGGTAQMEAKIALAVVETNTSYANSGVTQRIELAHTMETLPGDALNNFGADLNALSALNDGVFDNVDVARETYVADAVALLIDDGQYCGLGYLNSSATSAFTVTSWNCATGYYSFGHELGHNLSARHDWYVDGCTTGGTCPHNKGFVYLQDRWRTVMAYNSLCSDTPPGTYCNRLPYWSNPEVSYQGTVPMGVASDGPANCIEDSTSPDPSSCAADNRLAQNNSCDYFANFRQGVAPDGERLQINTSGVYGVSIASSTGHGGDSNYSYPVLTGTAVMLDAPATWGGATFVDWTGCPSPSGTQCALTMAGDITVTANYAIASFTLQVNTQGVGGVPVTSSTGHGGISNYSVVLDSNTQVSLWIPAYFDGALLTGWTGCEASNGAYCELLLTADTTVTANYQEQSCEIGTELQTLFQDDMETGIGSWTHGAAAGPDTWTLDASDANSPDNSWRAQDIETVSDQRLVSPVIALPAGASLTQAFFHHKFGIEATGDPGTCWDAAILEYSINGGVNWVQFDNNRLLTTPYTATVSADYGNPLGGLQAWCGTSDWFQSVVDISGLEGAGLQLRFRLGTDNTISADNWHIDDVLIQACVPFINEDILFSDGFETIP